MLYKMNGRWPKVKSSIQAIEQYKLDENPIYDFVEESGMLIKDASGRISIERFTELFNEYHSGKMWAKRSIRGRLDALGYESCTMKIKTGGRTTRKRAIRGLVEVGEHLSLLPEDSEEESDENA